VKTYNYVSLADYFPSLSFKKLLRGADI